MSVSGTTQYIFHEIPRIVTGGEVEVQEIDFPDLIAQLHNGPLALIGNFGPQNYADRALKELTDKINGKAIYGFKPGTRIDANHSGKFILLGAQTYGTNYRLYLTSAFSNDGSPPQFSQNQADRKIYAISYTRFIGSLNKLFIHNPAYDKMSLDDLVSELSSMTLEEIINDPEIQKKCKAIGRRAGLIENAMQSMIYTLNNIRPKIAISEVFQISNNPIGAPPKSKYEAVSRLWTGIHNWEHEQFHSGAVAVTTLSWAEAQRQAERTPDQPANDHCIIS